MDWRRRIRLQNHIRRRLKDAVATNRDHLCCFYQIIFVHYFCMIVGCMFCNHLMIAFIIIQVSMNHQTQFKLFWSIYFGLCCSCSCSCRRPGSRFRRPIYECATNECYEWVLRMVVVGSSNRPLPASKYYLYELEALFISLRVRSSFEDPKGMRVCNALCIFK